MNNFAVMVRMLPEHYSHELSPLFLVKVFSFPIFTMEFCELLMEDRGNRAGVSSSLRKVGLTV